ncbi:MAG: hypothetical protein NT150_15585 [Bacteroidetes bacterium]|nr:hypothetical protein [Bacteroidota bacterium]
MRSLVLIVFGVLVLSIFPVSCKKDTLESTITKSDTTVVRERLHQFEPETQTFEIPSNQAAILTGKNGVVIHVPANAFTDDKGNLINGIVNIELKEMLTLRDQITTGYRASSLHKTLISGGAFFLNAQINGQKVTLADSQFISVEVPALKVDSTMNVFIGNELGVFKTATSFDWVLADATFKKLITDTAGWDTITKAWKIDSSYVNAYDLSFGVNKYILKIHDMFNSNLYNVDRFANLNPVFSILPCTINAVSDATQEVIDFNVQILYKQYSSVGWGETMGLVTNNIVVNVEQEWAAGEEVIVVVIGVGKTSKKSYFGKTAFKIAANSKPVIDIVPMSDEELSTALDKL